VPIAANRQMHSDGVAGALRFRRREGSAECPAIAEQPQQVGAKQPVPIDGGDDVGGSLAACR